MVHDSLPARPIPPLRLWVPSSVSEPVVRLQGVPLPREDEQEVDSGRSFRVWPTYAGRLELRDDTSETLLLKLDIELRPRDENSLKAQLDAAVGNAAARDLLEQQWRQQRAGTTSSDQWLLLTRYLQYVTYDQGRWEDSAALAMEAAHMARRQGRVLTECGSTWSAAYLYGQQLGDNQRALEVLEQSCDYGEEIPQVVMERAYYRGLVLASLGRSWEAGQSFERALDIVRRIRLHQWQRIASAPLVEALAEQGRFGWARWLLERSQQLPGDISTSVVERCGVRADYHSSHGALAFREAQLTGGPADDARAHWERAAAVYADRSQCPDHAAHRGPAAKIQLGLARVDLAQGALTQAEERLEAIDPADLSPLHQLHQRLLRAELLIADARWKPARLVLDRLAAALDHKGSPARSQERWHFYLLRARLHHANGDGRRAIDALARAQRELGLGAPAVGVETDRYVAMRRQSGQLLVRVLLEQGLVGPALCAARIARARVQVGPTLEPLPPSPNERPLRERLAAYEWFDPRDIPVDDLMEIEAGLGALMSVRSGAALSMRCEDLPPPAPGELSLFPFDDGRGWVGFAWDEHEVIARPLAGEPSGSDPEALGRLLLSPFDDRLRHATRLRVVAPAVLHDTSMADLWWNGHPVGDVMAVAHAVDLPRVPPRAPSRRVAALVFSDPRQRLLDDQQALVEGFGRWATRLRAQGLSIIDRSPAASGGRPSIDEVLRDLEGVELALLYGFGATHRSRYALRSAGVVGEEVDQGTFDLGAIGLLRTDVLRQAGRVPRHVILAHCESALVDPYGISGAVGLAQSHVQAGSEWAVGTAGNVTPETMKRMVDDLIDAYARGSGIDRIARALHESRRRLRDTGFPDADLLRLWIP